MNYVFLFLIGVATWPMLEHILHRFSGHIYRFPMAFYQEHQTHHAKKDYFAPAWKKTAVAFIVLSLLTSLNYLWLGLLSAFIFSFGFVGMYLFYEWNHFAFHKFAPKTKLGLMLRKHHFAHHYVNPKMNFGVTNTIIDKMMGTYVEVKSVPVPKAFAMDWLKENDQKNALWSGHFEIR